MSPESLIAAAVTFFLALLGVWALLAPFCQPQQVEPEGADDQQERRDSLLIRKESALSELEELEEDRLTSRITDTEYEQGRESLTAEAGSYLRSLDELDAASTKSPVTELPRPEAVAAKKRNRS